MLRVDLGNFPPMSTAYLKVICSQELEVEDFSSCFRLPMAYVPSYMGDLCRDVPYGASISTDADLPQEPVDKGKDHITAWMELGAHPKSQGGSGVWDVSVRIKTRGCLTRLVSLNHPIDIKSNPQGSEVCVSLKDTVNKALVPCNDFVLLIRDSLVNKVSALTTGDTFADHQFASI